MRAVLAITLMLLVAAAPAERGADPPRRSIAEFVPSQHGFAFRNQFSGSPLPGALAGLPSPTGAAFGLCGGMSAAAADLFLARRAPPDAKTPPDKGSALYDYLYRRQLDSFGADLSVALRFAEWMRRPVVGFGGLPETTAREMSGIIDRVDGGEPVVLGLMYVRAGLGGVWDNHQVLAIGSRRPTRGVVELRVYDPNFPRHDGVVVRVVVRLKSVLWLPGTLPTPWPRLTADSVLRVPADPRGRSRGRPDQIVYGFFRVPYSPAEPPPGL